MTERIVATLDPSIEAVLEDLRPLVYAGGGEGSDDVPAHVRAASAIRRRGARLAIVQDDVNVLAMHDPSSGTHPELLPLGPGGRRTFDDKKTKMDLEACAALPDGRLLALGSGSTSARERLVVVDPDGASRLVEARDLYASLRATAAFAGSELNVEGALVVGGILRLFQRGNGAPRDGLEPVDATGDLVLADLLRWLDGGGPPPPLQRVVQFDLGEVSGVRFGFTDAALAPDGAVVFIACAEDSPDAVRDGEVLGCRFGAVEDGAARTADVVDASGDPVKLKLEGIEARPGRALTFDVVADMDRPDEPALLGRLRVSCRTRRW